MSLAAPDLRKLTDEEIWEQLHHGMVDSNLHRQCILMLEMRNTERQTKGITEQSKSSAYLVEATTELARLTGGLVGATSQLAKFTGGLVRATWALVGASVLLFLVSATQLGWSIYWSLHTLGSK